MLQFSNLIIPKKMFVKLCREFDILTSHKIFKTYIIDFIFFLKTATMKYM